MDTTIINSINLLSPENMEELRLFLNSLLKKQEKQVVTKANTQKFEEEEKPPFRHPLADMEPVPVNPIAEMEQIPVPTDIIINRYTIYEDNFIDRL